MARLVLLLLLVCVVCAQHPQYQRVYYGKPEPESDPVLLEYPDEKDLGPPRQVLSPAEADRVRQADAKKFYSPLEPVRPISDFGCCRICENPKKLEEQIPPPAEYGLSLREKRRNVSPEWGWESWKRAQVSCCPVCGFPIKPQKYAPLPNIPNEQHAEMAGYVRGDGITDEAAGVADKEAPNHTPALIELSGDEDADSEGGDKEGEEEEEEEEDPSLPPKLSPLDPKYKEKMRRPVPPPPEKPFNPLKAIKGDPLAYNLVSHPDLTWDQLYPHNPFREARIAAENQKRISQGKRPLRFPDPDMEVARETNRVQLPPCCEVCQVGNPHIFSNTPLRHPDVNRPLKDNFHSCCYYCANRKFEFKPSKLKPTVRPEKKPRWSLEQWHKIQQKPQGRSIDVFNPPIPVVHANRGRFDN